MTFASLHKQVPISLAVLRHGPELQVGLWLPAFVGCHGHEGELIWRVPSTLSTSGCIQWPSTAQHKASGDLPQTFARHMQPNRHDCKQTCPAFRHTLDPN